jgi:hypothetical protein
VRQKRETKATVAREKSGNLRENSGNQYKSAQNRRFHLRNRENARYVSVMMSY